MKNIVCILLFFCFLSCQKEDNLTSTIHYEHLYSVENDPTDTVKKRVYAIYEKYGIPVYFNDTVGRVFVKEDIRGDSVYQYETLDLAWGFTSTSGIQFRYEYLENREEQLLALDLIENYLKSTPKVLYPFNFFVVKSANIVDAAGNIDSYGDGKQYSILFRTLLLINDGNLSPHLPETLKCEMVKHKISNYPVELAAFYNKSKSVWYGMLFRQLDAEFYEYFTYPYSKEYGFDMALGYGAWYEMGYIPLQAVSIPENFFSSSFFKDDWSNRSHFTEEGLEKFRTVMRQKIGAWGFISPGTMTPSTTEADLDSYVEKMLSMSKTDFEALWGTSPLVMEKYNILFDILVNKLEMEL